ncbi:hypothetical protein BDV36DRAFT_9038 [Aspergillus pseudocaelatus]|uniref:Uncharacterized protein n=1 Tax=Aspergillus pseudocaelatus TaxID=1825620 RepID=A0ABQ6WB43_9EURO|nr:hypothetical protein BDV36DRAFT_9038 [Aspergillus pseudocaelatus]
MPITVRNEIGRRKQYLDTLVQTSHLFFKTPMLTFCTLLLSYCITRGYSDRIRSPYQSTHMTKLPKYIIEVYNFSFFSQ